MLDACAELLDEVGYEALSTTRVAERAGVAVGSVYQFFPDKRALNDAVTRRNVEVFVARVGRRFISEDYAGWWDAVDAIIDEYVDMHRNVPGFRSLHFGEVFDLNLLDSVADNNTVIAGRSGRCCSPSSGSWTVKTWIVPFSSPSRQVTPY